MKLDVLISTCNERILGLHKLSLKQYENIRYLIIHQVFDGKCDFEKIRIYKKTYLDRGDIDLYTVYERGLSKSRNLAISKSQADICLIADDDVVFINGALLEIISAYQKSDCDIIAFRMLDPEKNFVREYPEIEPAVKQINRYHDAFQFWSPEISFKRESIRKRGIKFNEKFGVGTSIPISEENIFLSDCFKSGLKIAHGSMPILVLPSAHSGMRQDEKIWFARGVVWFHLYGFWFILKIFKRALVNNERIDSLKKIGFFLCGGIYFVFWARKFFIQ